ncbi:MAG: hypothetical protein A3F83_03185 [Candidatus Glassbacteria bacterium RIFCSPLOWO2_12_FULL_58_11]|uniref:Glycoside hydrolase 123 C-terminal domain-containing protein n=1 Tax=Candidatus Glassbacteria bacterium RIFCSPLOWO2_12_FULL_58_11 TaxID=1817867 RepID=A0A1F5YYM7_9BACT|nr:MAG: hypothetical protein A3F83_03185 [Candidatus Glassbacteria bacterium RIFCSPLOWO2_12_FULL_58_11]
MNGHGLLKSLALLSLCSLCLAAGLASQLAGPDAERPFLDRLNAEIIRDIAGFKNDPFVESTALEPLEPRWKELGFIPFSRAFGSNVYPNSIPALAERGAPLEGFAAPGEAEPLVLGVRALSTGLSGLKITSEGLVCQDTEGYLPPDSLEIGVVEFARVRWGAGSDARAWRWHPSRIWPWNDYPGSPFSRPDTNATLRIMPNTTQHFWIRVHTPINAPAGRYEGGVQIESERGSYRVEVHFTVLPVRLSSRGLPPYGVFLPGPQDLPAIQDLAAHGINTVARWFDPSRLPAINDKGSIAFDFGLEDNFIERLSAAGIDRPQIMFAGNPAGAPFDSCVAAAAGLALNSPEFYTAYAQAAQSIVEHALRQGWPRQVWGIYDRLAGGTKDSDSFVARAKALRKVMGGSISLVSPIIGGRKGGTASAVAPYVDVWLLGEEAETEKNMKELAIWSFVPCTQRDNALEARARTGFEPWRRGLDGVFVWAYNWSGGGHSWNDFDSPVMDWMLSYRDFQDHYLPTPAWEGVREGIEDRRYLLTLQELVSSYPEDSPAAIEVRGLLEALRAAPLDSPSFAARIGLDEDAPRSNDSSPAGLARRAIAGLLIRLVRGG